MKYFSIIVVFFALTSRCFSAAEYRKVKDKITFSFNELELMKISSANPTTTNHFIAPTIDELVTSTVARTADIYEKLIYGSKENLLEAIIKENQRLLAIEEIGDQNEIEDSKSRLSWMIYLYRKK